MDEQRANARYLRALREHWIYVPFAIALAVAGAVVYSQVADERYEASADVLVSPVSSDTLVGLPVLRENVFGRSVVTVARVMKSPQVAARVRTNLNLALPLSDVSDLITVTPQEQSDIITLTGKSGTPEEAASVANAFARALIAERGERFQRQLALDIARLSSRLNAIGDSRVSAEAATISSRLADYRVLLGGGDPTLEIVSAAVPPSSAAWPRTTLSVTVAALLGLLVGVAVAIGVGVANPGGSRAATSRNAHGLPILARMPKPSGGDVRAALSDDEVPLDLRGPIRTLWANLGSLEQGSENGTYLVLGESSSNGRSQLAPAVAALLGAAMARAGRDVTVVDADLERRPLAELLDNGGAYMQLGRSRSDDASAVPALQSHVAAHRLHVMLANPDNSELAESMPPDRLSQLVVDVKGRGRTLVIPVPALPAAETTMLLDLADAVIVPVAPGDASSDRLAELRDELVRRGVGRAGLVVLETPSLPQRVGRFLSRQKSAQQRRWAQAR
jgi:capsular polysaccharide biosynthesis protein/Mrp family chromosome partitioning ATPase